MELWPFAMQNGLSTYQNLQKSAVTMTLAQNSGYFCFEQ